MGKRKGKVDPSANPELKGKRLRENGRLKRQHDADDKHMDKIQDKLLIDAGVDKEMIKSISDVEKQAIVKAIVESNPELNLDAAQSSSSSSESKGSPSALSLNDDEETQPPDAIEMCESPYSDAGLQLDNNLQSDQEDKETLPREDLEDKSVCSSPLSHIEEDNNNNCPLDGDPTQQYEFEVSKPLSERHKRDNSPLRKRQNTSSILATETQFSPSYKGNENDLDPIPESPSSSCLDTEDEESAKPRENEIESTSFMKNYQAKPRATVLNLLPRYSINDAGDPCLYSQVIKLMFDIYIRRLRSTQAQLKTVPTPWGNPVKRGKHCENILRREVVEYIDAENSNKRGRGRPLRRRLDKESDNTKDLYSNEGDDQEKTPACRSRKSDATSTFVGVSGDASTTHTVMIDDEKASGFTEAVGTITVHRSVEDSDEEISVKTVVPASEHARSVLSNSNKRKKRKDERNIITEHPEKEEQNPSSPEIGITMLSLKKRKDVKEKLAKEEDEIEILEKDDADNGSISSWLSSEKGKGKKRTSSKDRSIPKKKRPRSDSPIIENEKNTKDVGQRKIAGEQVKSKKMFPEEVLCVIDENSESGSLPDLLQDNEEEVVSRLNSKLDKGKEKAGTRKQEDRIGQSSRSREKVGTDAIPISLDSGDIINLDGDLYGTQMTAKVDKTRRRMSRSTTNDVSEQTSNSPAIVASCSYVKNKSSKKKEMEDFESESEINERDFGSRCEKSNDVKKRNLKKKLVIDDNRLRARKTVDDVLVELNSESEEDVSVLNNPWKSASRSLDEKGKGVGKGPGKKKKRTLFSEDSYSFTEIQPKQLDDARDSVGEGVQQMFGDGERVGKMKSSEKRSSHRGVSSEDNNTQQASTNQRAEENVEQSTCPICGKVFPLVEIEAHASSCGEGIEEEDNAQQGMTECMICHKEVDRDYLKRHQNLCATSRKDQQELPAKRVTRGKRDAPSKKQIFAKEKSPSSSGEDFGELVIEVDDRSR